MRSLPAIALVGLVSLGGCERRSGDPEPGATQTEEARASPSPQHDPEARFVVLERDDELFAVVPDGSEPIQLGIPALPQKRGITLFANDQPLMSPDGQTLAHLVDGALRITHIPSLASHSVAGLDGPVLIGSWSPDGRALLTVEENSHDLPARNVHVVDVATLTTTLLRNEGPVDEVQLMQWGNDSTELLLYHPFGDSTGVARISLPDLEVVQVPGIEWRPAWMIADVRANHIVGRRPGYLWIYGDDAPTRRDLVAVPLYFWSEVHLSPDARHIASCIGEPQRDTLVVPGQLMVVPVAGGPGEPVTECRVSSTFYWYDNEHLVMERLGMVDLVSLGGEVVTLADNASLVAQRRHGKRQ